MSTTDHGTGAGGAHPPFVEAPRAPGLGELPGTFGTRARADVVREAAGPAQ